MSDTSLYVYVKGILYIPFPHRIRYTPLPHPCIRYTPLQPARPAPHGIPGASPTRSALVLVLHGRHLACRGRRGTGA